MRYRFAFVVVLAACASAEAQVSAVVAIEPTLRKDGLMLSRTGLEAALGKTIGQAVAVTTSEDLADVMRATRSQGFDIFIAPAQVAASALLRGYELVGSTDAADHFVLVGKARYDAPTAVKGGRIYLPQQDSIYTYMARGILNANGLSFSDLKRVEYARYPEAGLTAVSIGTSDATVVRRSEWDQWTKANPGVGKVLAASGAVPGGFSVVVRSDLPADTRARLARWFSGSSTGTAGMRPVTVQAGLGEYKVVAQLGFFTPTHLPAATVVKADEVQRLLAAGAVLVDTRTEKEYRTKRMPQAVFVPYVEKSLKDVAFDARQDDFSGAAKLDKARPTIFACNGAECWKSYKASKVATQQGFEKVYWFRGGLPEWEAAGLAVTKEATAPK